MSHGAPLISIIVPVYNTDRFLHACLDSILSQSVTDWELLLIDDGSADQGGRICDLYAQNDSRIHVFHQKHAGQSRARNVGLDHANGTYITMVDSDDLLLSEHYLAYLYDALAQYNAQISTVGLRVFSGHPPLHSSEDTDRILFCGSGLDAYAMSGSLPTLRYGNSVGKLFERSLFRRIRYPVGRLAEDNAISHHLFSPCDPVVVLKPCLYGYRMHEQQTMSSTDSKTLIRDTLAAFEDRMNYFRRIDRADLARQAEQELLQILQIIRRRPNLPSGDI